MSGGTGRVVGERHTVEEEVAEGILGTVLRAHDEAEDAPVAIEVARDAALAVDDLADRLRRGVEAANAVAHPALVRVVEVGDDDGRPYVARTWVDGTDVGRRYAAGPPDRAEAVGVLEQVADALDHVHHAGLVHGDVGSACVLVRDTPNGARAHLTGLGVRSALLEAGAGPTITLGTGTAGLPGALAPELAAGAEAGPAADVYALACLAFELLTGTPPFTGPTGAAVLAAHANRPRPRASARNPALPAAVDAVLEAGMAVDPADRPSSATALVGVLATALGPEVVVGDATVDGTPPPPLVTTPAGAFGTEEAFATRAPARRRGEGRSDRRDPVVAPPRRRAPRWVLPAALVVALAGGVPAGLAIAASDDAPSSSVDVPALPAPPRLQDRTNLPLRPAQAPGPAAQVAIVGALRQFVSANGDPSDRFSWQTTVSPLVVGEAAEDGGRCVRSPAPSAPTTEANSPGLAWLRRERVDGDLPWAFEGLRPAAVRFRNPRLASWEGTAVAPGGGRSPVRVWLSRAGLAGSWKVLYLDLCPRTGASS